MRKFPTDNVMVTMFSHDPLSMSGGAVLKLAGSNFLSHRKVPYKKSLEGSGEDCITKNLQIHEFLFPTAETLLGIIT